MKIVVGKRGENRDATLMRLRIAAALPSSRQPARRSPTRHFGSLDRVGSETGAPLRFEAPLPVQLLAAKTPRRLLTTDF